jgi:quercetin dioxygenase-like cupin family protein
MLKLVLISSLFISSLSAFAAAEADHVMINASDIKWGDAPPSLPAGAKAAVLFGDPNAQGPFGLRLKLPANYVIPPHTHPQDENVTVISGTLLMGMGDDVKAKPMMVHEGGFARMKAGTHHFAKSEKEVILQLNSIGPWGINYINPADDPRNKKK